MTNWLQAVGLRGLSLRDWSWTSKMQLDDLTMKEGVTMDGATILELPKSFVTFLKKEQFIVKSQTMSRKEC